MGGVGGPFSCLVPGRDGKLLINSRFGGVSVREASQEGQDDPRRKAFGLAAPRSHGFEMIDQQNKSWLTRLFETVARGTP